jgi:hypothetical protein
LDVSEVLRPNNTLSEVNPKTTIRVTHAKAKENVVDIDIMFALYNSEIEEIIQNCDIWIIVLMYKVNVSRFQILVAIQYTSLTKQFSLFLLGH